MNRGRSNRIGLPARRHLVMVAPRLRLLTETRAQGHHRVVLCHAHIEPGAVLNMMGPS